MTAQDTPSPKILVVDDTAANLVAMRLLLSRVSADIVTVDSGNAALAACLSQTFAVILLDVQMPEMDGFEVAELLSQEESTKNTPIIFVSAAYDDVTRLKGYGAGAVDYIAKPVNEAILLSKIRVFLELYNNKLALQKALESMFTLNCKLRDEVQERQRAEDLAKYEATHDHLTDIPNRALFQDRLSTALERTRRNGKPFALLYIDIDGFKSVNDTHGHHWGDLLLVAIALRLKDRFRRTDTLARIGGDEFAIIIEEQSPLEAELLKLGEGLCQLISQPYILDDKVTVTVGASIGVALYPQCGNDSADERESIIRAADMAMYQAKRAGKNQACIQPFSDQYVLPSAVRSTT